jgi:NADPH:quinone reductase
MLALVNTPDGGEPVEIREVDEPDPATDETLVEVRAFSINRGELSLLSSRPEGWRPGQDVAGVVAQAAADGSGPPQGARVVAVADEAGWAERAAAPSTRVGILPDDVSFGAGSTLGVAGLTALRALRTGGSLLGARVLVTGASGEVGRFAVQLVRMGGADVTAVAGSEERAEGLEDLGASRVVVGAEDPG